MPTAIFDYNTPAISTVEVQETWFGSVVREVEPRGAADGVLRSAMRMGGGVLVFFALAIWQASTGWAAADLVSMKIGISVAMLALAAMLVGGSVAPEVPEVQIDTGRREVRFARRRAGGNPRLTASVAMDHITGVTVEPVVEGSEHCHLSFTIDGCDHGLLVVSGLRTELLPIAARLRRDLRPASRRIEDRLAA